MFTILQVATLFEATHLIRSLHLERVRLPEWSHCYRGQKGGVFLWISGIGKKATLRSLQRLSSTFATLPQPRHWMNIGIAGCNHTEIPVGTLFRVNRIHLPADAMSESNSPTPCIFLPNSRCSSLPTAALTTVATAQNSPSTSPREAPCMLFDMEAFHWAHFLKTHFQSMSELSCVKIVSDHTDGTSLDFRSLAPAYDSAIEDLLLHLSLSPPK